MQAKIDLGAARDQAIQKMRDAFANSKGDVQPVAPAGVSSQAPASALRLDAAERSRQISEWSRDLFKSANGIIL